MNTDEAQSRGRGARSQHALTIAFLYPRWQPQRRSQSLDVLGYALASGIQGPNRAVMLAQGPGHDPDAPIRFLVGPLQHNLSRVAVKVHMAANRLGMANRVRWVTELLSSRHSYDHAAARSVANLGADVAHIFVYDRLVPKVAEAAPSTKIVLHMQDHAQRRNDRDLVANHLSMCHLVVACSDYLARVTRAHFPEFADKIVAVPNSVPEMPGPRPPSQGEDLIFVGRLSPEKGVHILISAFVEVALRHPEATLTLVGPRSIPGPEVFETQVEDPVFEEAYRFVQARAAAYAAHLESLIPRKIKSRIRFAGDIPNKEATSLIRDSTVLVLPSIWEEPFGIPALEASAAGVPAVVTRSGALPEIIEDGVTGLVIERNDVGSLAAAMSRLLSNPDMASEMGRAGVRRARQRFGWTDYVRTWQRIYQSLAAG